MGSAHHPGSNERWAESIVQEVGLDPAWLDRDASGLSGGERQRLAIAVALRTDPAILALDEPTSALDPASARRVAEVLRARSGRDGLTTIAVTHNRDHAAWLGDRAVVLEAGKVADRGTTADVLARDDASFWVRGGRRAMIAPGWLGVAWAGLPLLACMGLLAWLRLGQVGPMAVALVRLVVLLWMLGIVLKAVFAADSPWVVMLTASAMLAVAAHTVGARQPRRRWLIRLESLVAMGLGIAVPMAVCVTLALRLKPWYSPSTFIPLFGMILGNSVTGISLAAERLAADPRGGPRPGRATARPRGDIAAGGDAGDASGRARRADARDQ